MRCIFMYTFLALLLVGIVFQVCRVIATSVQEEREYADAERSVEDGQEADAGEAI